MSFIKKQTPRSFHYQPLYYKPEEDNKIRFRSITTYNASRSRSVWLYPVLLIVIAALIYMLGGVRPQAKLPTLTTDDVVDTSPVED